jgi:hypothetical protein
LKSGEMVPVTSDAAVAAVAKLRSVPSTSILDGDMRDGPACDSGDGVSSKASCPETDAVVGVGGIDASGSDWNE